MRAHPRLGRPAYVASCFVSSVLTVLPVNFTHDHGFLDPPIATSSMAWHAAHACVVSAVVFLCHEARTSDRDRGGFWQRSVRYWSALLSALRLVFFCSACLAAALRWIRLICAGDVELLPGPSTVDNNPTLALEEADRPRLVTRQSVLEAGVALCRHEALAATAHAERGLLYHFITLLLCEALPIGAAQARQLPASGEAESRQLALVSHGASSPGESDVFVTKSSVKNNEKTLKQVCAHEKIAQHMLRLIMDGEEEVLNQVDPTVLITRVQARCVEVGITSYKHLLEVCQFFALLFVEVDGASKSASSPSLPADLPPSMAKKAHKHRVIRVLSGESNFGNGTAEARLRSVFLKPAWTNSLRMFFGTDVLPLTESFTKEILAAQRGISDEGERLNLPLPHQLLLSQAAGLVGADPSSGPNPVHGLLLDSSSMDGAGRCAAEEDEQQLLSGLARGNKEPPPADPPKPAPPEPAAQPKPKPAPKKPKPVTQPKKPLPAPKQTPQPKTKLPYDAPKYGKLSNADMFAAAEWQFEFDESGWATHCVNLKTGEKEDLRSNPLTDVYYRNVYCKNHFCSGEERFNAEKGIHEAYEALIAKGKAADDAVCTAKANWDAAPGETKDAREADLRAAEAAQKEAARPLFWGHNNIHRNEEKLDPDSTKVIYIDPKDVPALKDEGIFFGEEGVAQKEKLEKSDKLYRHLSAGDIPDMKQAMGGNVFARMHEAALTGAREFGLYDRRPSGTDVACLVVNRAPSMIGCDGYPAHDDTSRGEGEFGGADDGVCVLILTLVLCCTCWVLIPIIDSDGKWVRIIRFPVYPGGVHGLRRGARLCTHAIHFDPNGGLRYSINLRLSWNTLAEGLLALLGGYANFKLRSPYGRTPVCAIEVAITLLTSYLSVHLLQPAASHDAAPCFSGITPDFSSRASAWLIPLMIDLGAFPGKFKEAQCSFEDPRIGLALCKLALGVMRWPSCVDATSKDDLFVSMEVFDLHHQTLFESSFVTSDLRHLDFLNTAILRFPLVFFELAYGESDGVSLPTFVCSGVGEDGAHVLELTPDECLHETEVHFSWLRFLLFVDQEGNTSWDDATGNLYVSWAPGEVKTKHIAFQGGDMMIYLPALERPSGVDMFEAWNSACHKIRFTPDIRWLPVTEVTLRISFPAPDCDEECASPVLRCGKRKEGNGGGGAAKRRSN